MLSEKYSTSDGFVETWHHQQEELEIRSGSDLEQSEYCQQRSSMLCMHPSVCVFVCLLASCEPQRLDTDEQTLTGISSPSHPLHGVASPIMGTWSEAEQRGSSGGGGRGDCVVRLLWETLQRPGPPICPLELFVTVSSTVILPLLFLGGAISAALPLTYP